MNKHLPFGSHYLPDFHVVRQREGNINRFPHPDQLPKLLRALNLDFLTGLPDRIARVDHRAKDFQKIAKHSAALMFCNQFNEARKDNLRLWGLTDKNMVARISIVQQIIEYTNKGALRRFKFYGGDDFFSDVYINGKRIAFSGHAVDRFSERVPNPIGTDLTNLFELFYGSPIIAMLCNARPALIYDYQGSVIAFPIKESDAELILLTCLSINEISDLEPIIPPSIYTLHYDPVYKEPEARNWDVIGRIKMLLEKWQSKVPLPLPAKTAIDSMSWPQFANKINDYLKHFGIVEGSRFSFLDNIHGPCTFWMLPGAKEKRHIKLEDLKPL